jgi:hypothetical protein
VLEKGNYSYSPYSHGNSFRKVVQVLLKD